MAFQKDGDAICEITQTYVIRSHAAPVLTKAKTITDVAVVKVDDVTNDDVQAHLVGSQRAW